jgi:molecular chaperone HscB
MSTTRAPNHFVLLGLPESCDVDLQALDAQYRRLQAQWHPDRHAAAAPAERLAALQQASLLNEAYTILKTPLRRAGYLLELNGVDLHHARTVLEPEFLFAQLRLREELEQLQAARDDAGLRDLMQRTRAQHAALWREFSNSADAGRFAAARGAFHKMQFLAKLEEEVAAAEDRLLD